MGTPVIQTSFNAGELSPSLYARVDIQKYHSSAALLRNFFVDYRGGATTRPGTGYVAKAKSNSVRLIPFKASFAVTYVLEFGPNYIRFHSNGAPIVEGTKSITAASSGPPEVFTSTAHGYANGDWIFAGGSYYIVQGVTANTFTLTDLFGNAINTNPLTLPASAARVYQISTPYAANDLFGIKYCQDINLLFLCHPNYAPQVLTLNSAANWTIAPINFAPTIAVPVGLGISVAGTGSGTFSYVVTSVDNNGQESSPSTPIQTNAAGGATTQTISWTAVKGATSYNVYRTAVSVTTTIPGGIPYGFIGTATSNSFLDTNISPDFSQVAPTPENPFQGAGVQSVTITNRGSGYTSAPGVSFTAAPGGGVTAQGYATMLINTGATSLLQAGSGFVVGGTYPAQGYPSVIMTVTGTGFNLSVTSYVLSSSLILSSGLPTSFNFFGQGIYASIGVTWLVNSIVVTNPGDGYLATPSVAISFGGATAVATLGSSSSGNPSVPALIQQRLFLGGPVLSPAQFNMSQPGAPFNFNVSFPIAPDDAIQATLTSTTLHAIKAALPVQSGLAIFTDQALWLVNGGSPGAPISATQISANPQGYSGSSDVAPITTPLDILYVQAKGSIVRDLQYNFYLNNYVGADISVLSAHLFYGLSIPQWAFAEEPFKLVWAVRSDGDLLSLTFLKEQELIAWTHHDTQGNFVSVASVNEATAIGNVDATYFAVARQVQGQAVTYIERLTDLGSPQNYIQAWQVDAGISFGNAVGGSSTSITITFDPASARNVTLSNGNLTATNTGTAVSGDSSFSNVVLLMGFEGANGSTGAPGLTDESPAAHGTGTLINTSLGNISTAQFKFGASSLFINGTSSPSGLTFPFSSDWNLGAGLFTIEMWVYLPIISGSQVFASQWGLSGQFGWQFGLTGGNKLSWFVSVDGTTILTDANGTWTPVANTWYYVTVDYDGIKYRVYVNGTMIGSSATPRTIFPSNLKLGIGSFYNGLNLMDGFVDELRITKGVARYATDTSFTVPTSAFPRVQATPAPTNQGVEVAIAQAHTSGKWYFEMTLTNDVDHGSTIGVATTSATYPNLNANGTGGIACYINGSIFTNGSNSGAAIGGMVNGDVIGVALDLNNRAIWFKPVAGSQVGTGWNGSGIANPATNVGGVSVPIGAILPYVSYSSGSPGNTWTANFGATAFAGTVPSGFNNWGTPSSLTLSGAQHLGGLAVTGLADGAVINFTMPISGTFSFGPGGTPGLEGITNPTVVTVGLSFLPQLQTLPLDLGEPTQQGKRKKISAVTVRIKDALGLQIGRLATTLVAMKDLAINNIGTMTNAKVTDLVTGDARTIVDPLWDVYGQYLIQQPNPYPATVLGVIPEIVTGDKDK